MTTAAAERGASTADRGILPDMARDIDSARVLWTVTDAARELGASRQSVYDWLGKGMPVAARIRFGKSGWTPLFDPREARAWHESYRNA